MIFTRQKCLKLFADIVRARDKVCAVCGKDGKLDVHHILSRKFVPFQHGILLCPSCHTFGFKSAGNSVWFSEWLKDNRPLEFDIIKKFKYKKIKWDYKKVYNDLLKER